MKLPNPNAGPLSGSGSEFEHLSEIVVRRLRRKDPRQQLLIQKQSQFRSLGYQPTLSQLVSYKLRPWARRGFMETRALKLWDEILRLQREIYG